MNAVQLRDFGHALQGAQIETRNPATRRSEAQLGIKELQVLREVDMLAPAEAATAVEHLVDAYRGTPTSGDHLRLPQRTSLDGPAMRAALDRVLRVDTSRAAGPQGQVVAEERMRRVLRAIETTVADIQRQAAMGVRY